MNFVLYEVPKDWCCEECLQSAEAVSNGNLTVHQFSHQRTSKKIVAGKVKFITNEEVATLTSRKRSHGKQNRSAYGHSSDCTNVKPCPLSWKKVTSTLPSSMAVKVPFRPRKWPDYAIVDISASEHAMTLEPFNKEKERETAVQVCKMKPVEGKASATTYNFSETSSKPKINITDSLCADDGLTSMVDKHIENKAPLKGQDDYLLKDEQPNASLVVKGERDLHKKRDANILPGTAVGSILQSIQILSQKMVLPLKLIISSDEKHHHAVEACWRGAFEVLDFCTQFYGTVNAHLSCQVSPKVYDVSKNLPGTLQFNMLARESVWPKIFKLDPPTKDDVALYFRCEVERHKENYAHFIQQIDLHDYALQSCIADVELLLFTSALQIDSQCLNRDIYLWGVFRHLKKKKASHGEENALSFSPCMLAEHTTNGRSKVPLEVNSSEVTMEFDKLRGSSLENEVEMDIDMIGGCSTGRIDVPIKRENAPPMFSKPIQKTPMSFSLKKSTNPHSFGSAPPGFPFPAYKRSVPAPPGKSNLASSGTTRN